MMKRVVAAVSVGLTLLLAGCGNGNETGAVASTDAPTAGEPAGMPPGEPAKPHATPLIPSTEAANAASEAAEAAEKVASAAKKVKVTFVMPNLVGKNLQKAQDDLQSLGSYLLDEQDATGKGRITVLDSDWKVCGQKPTPGAKVLIVATVQLASVKLNESCP
jgi:PASTA domain